MGRHAACPRLPPSDIHACENGAGLPMQNLLARGLSRKWLGPVVAGLFGLASLPSLAAEEPDVPKDGPKGAAVTVLKAAKSCFSNIVDVSGILIPKEETSVRPERPGLKVAEIRADAGDTVTAGQTLARLTLPEGGTQQLQAPVPVRAISKLAVNQTARIKIIGAGEVDGKVRRVATTIEPNSQLGQVFVSVTTNRRLLVNSSARALIKTGQSCGVSVPLTAILYGSAGTVVQVVRRQRVETRRVEIGLMSGGQVEVREGLQEGDIVVARAGALLREGDPVRPVTASAEGK